MDGKAENLSNAVLKILYYDFSTNVSCDVQRILPLKMYGERTLFSPCTNVTALVDSWDHEHFFSKFFKENIQKNVKIGRKTETTDKPCVRQEGWEHLQELGLPARSESSTYRWSIRSPLFLRSTSHEGISWTTSQLSPILALWELLHWFDTYQLFCRYNNNMAVGQTYTICQEADGDYCSNTVISAESWEHMWYFDRNLGEWGVNGCPSSWSRRCQSIYKS